MQNEKYFPIRRNVKDGQITLWPSKKHKVKQQLVLDFLLEKIDPQKQYTEKEISQLLNQHHTFGDAALLRREMIGRQMLQRKNDCSAYWVKK